MNLVYGLTLIVRLSICIIDARVAFRKLNVRV